MRITKLSTMIAAGAMALACIGGCGNSGSESTEGANGEAAASVEGQLTAAGSTALQPLAQQAADEFMKQNPNAIVTVNGGGSGEGLKQVSEGSVNIGNSDVFAEEKLDADAAKELVDHQIAVTVMAPVVSKDLAVDNLTSEQLKDIFTGKVTNWKEVGGPDKKVLLVTRPSSSGTRALFKEYALGGAEEASNSALETDDSGTLLQNVSQNEGAIGYVGLAYLVNNTDVKAVSVDDVEPTLENTYNGTYTVWGYEHMYTKGEPDELSKAFIDFISGEEFGAEIEKLGYGVASKLTDEAKATHK